MTNEDDAGRCRSDARAQPSTAFVAAERVGGTVARAGVDIARLREKNFRERPLLYLLEMEAALNGLELREKNISAHSSLTLQGVRRYYFFRVAPQAVARSKSVPAKRF